MWTYLNDDIYKVYIYFWNDGFWPLSWYQRTNLKKASQNNNNKTTTTQLFSVNMSVQKSWDMARKRKAHMLLWCWWICMIWPMLTTHYQPLFPMQLATHSQTDRQTSHLMEKPIALLTHDGVSAISPDFNTLVSLSPGWLESSCRSLSKGYQWSKIFERNKTEYSWHCLLILKRLIVHVHYVTQVVSGYTALSNPFTAKGEFD